MRKILIVSLLVIAADVLFGVPVRSMLGAERNKTGEEPELPFDAEVEYIRSVNVSCYIDTGLIITDFLLSIKTKTTNVGINEIYEFGAGDTTSGVILYQAGRYPTSAKRIYTDGKTVFQSYSETIECVDVPIHINYLDDTLVLFNARTSEGIIRSNNGGFTCYYLKIKDIYGMDILDFIPVRFTNEDGFSEGAMFDKVTKKLFRNNGFGEFIIGPDKE